MHKGYSTPLVIAIMAFALVGFFFTIDYAISDVKWPWSTDSEETVTNTNKTRAVQHIVGWETYRDPTIRLAFDHPVSAVVTPSAYGNVHSYAWVDEDSTYQVLYYAEGNKTDRRRVWLTEETEGTGTKFQFQEKSSGGRTTLMASTLGVQVIFFDGHEVDIFRTGLASDSGYLPKNQNYSNLVQSLQYKDGPLFNF